MDLGLGGKTVLITGSSQGIGKGLAEAFAEEGCHLRLAARSAVKLEGIAEDLRGRFGVDIQTIPVDITALAAVETIIERAGKIDILVNNAGGIPGGHLWNVDESAWRKGWDLKVLGYINLVRAFYPGMKERGGGVILNNIGNAGENFDFDFVAVSSGNASLMAFTRALGGRSLEDGGIRVIGVNTGPVATDRIVTLLKKRALAQFNDESEYLKLMADFPLGRPATVREVADLFVFLASPRASYISGTIVTIDGGISSRRSV